MIPVEEVRAIHLDWWGKCRSCRFWNGADKTEHGLHHYRWEPAKCECPESELFGQETWTEGYCPKWDSFDTKIALEMLEESYNDPRDSRNRS